MNALSYDDFLRAKVKIAPQLGFDVSPRAFHPRLLDHQRAVCLWAVRGGRRAIFAAFGLGKGGMQLEILRETLAHAGGQGLIIAPLGVRQEFFREAEALGLTIRFIRSAADIDPTDGALHITNYETVRDSKQDQTLITAVSLDEASVLRSYGSKTYQTFLRLFEHVPYRFVATATPSPNRLKELIHYAGFLGIMDTGQALTRWFQRDSQKANSLTLYPHKEREFWLWCNTWGVFLQKPSDLGFSDEGYALPELDVRYHEVETQLFDGTFERDGQGVLIRYNAVDLAGAAREKRDTLPSRVAKVMEIIANERRGSTDLHAGVPHQEQGTAPAGATHPKCEALSGEQGAISLEIEGVARSQPAEVERTSETTSRCQCRTDEGAKQGVAPQQQGASERSGSTAEACQLRTHGRDIPADAERAERRLRDMRGDDRPEEQEDEPLCGPLPCDGHDSGLALSEVQRGSRHASRRSVVDHESSGLPDQIILWCDLNDEQRALERALEREGISVTSLHGSQDIEAREEMLAGWRSGTTSVFLSKPTMYGCGINMQQSHTMIFAGIGFKFQDFIQAVHRAHRFLQVHPVTVHIIHAESEREVLRVLLRKWSQHEEMMETMSAIIREHGLEQLNMASEMQRAIGVERQEAAGEGWRVTNNDCVAETKLMADGSVDLIVTSIPFANHYEYTPSYNDFGHTESNDHFWRQMDFLTPELFRVLSPGRIAAIHVKDRILFGNVTGYGRPSVSPFHMEAGFHFMRHGFVFCGMITVVTDVVAENNGTYRLGYTEMLKDASKMGVGSPEYVLLFFKPQSDLSKGYADMRIARAREDYSLARWQVDAHAFWRCSGDRLLTVPELAAMPTDVLARAFSVETLKGVYDYRDHVAIGEALEARDALPTKFMALAPGSADPDVWHDIVRMRTLNGEQAAKGREKHICPLQIEIVDRLIERYSMRGETVFDPFGGLFTVPYCAMALGRRGAAVELNEGYFRDGVRILEAQERRLAVPTLFGWLDAQREAAE